MQAVEQFEAIKQKEKEQAEELDAARSEARAATGGWTCSHGWPLAWLAGWCRHSAARSAGWLADWHPGWLAGQLSSRICVPGLVSAWLGCVASL